MKLSRTLSVTLLALLISAPLCAETIAVTVRETSEHEEAALLAASVEQGAMDQLFGAGHIVFDLVIDSDDDLYLYRALDLAADGGAGYTIVIDLLFASGGERDLRPRAAGVTLLDVVTEEELARVSLAAEDLENYPELTPGAIADRLGRLAADAVLETIAGGNSAW